jgi:phage-related protein
MSNLTYHDLVSPRDKPLVWLRGEVKTPPFSANARVEAGFLLRRLQRGELLGLPHSRPMPSVASGCHELRIVDGDLNWRIMYYIATDAVVILDVFRKKTETTPKSVLDDCRRRLAEFLKLTQPKKGASRASR